MISGISLRDNIPLTFTRVSAGILVAGLTVTVVVIDARDGSMLLTSSPCSEVYPGVYTHIWNHSLTSETECLAIYDVAGSKFVENFTVMDDEVISVAT